MKQKEIFWVNLNPGEGNEHRGLRPAVIISGNILNENMNVCIICPLSSSIKNYPGCIILKKNKLNNLTIDSEVLTFQIRTVSSSRLMNRIGEITEEELEQILLSLNKILKY